MPSCVWANWNLMGSTGRTRKADGHHVILRLFGCQGWMMDGKSQGNKKRVEGPREGRGGRWSAGHPTLGFKGG